MGELPARVVVVGCEAADLGGDDGAMGLSPEVQAAVNVALKTIERFKFAKADYGRGLIVSGTMTCSQSVKLIGVVLAVGAAAMLVAMYPDMKRYIKLERM